MGKDIFVFAIYLDYASTLGVVPRKAYGDSLPSTDDIFKTGIGASYWIVNFDNAEYLKAGDDGKCKNNTNITLDGNTNVSCK